MAGRHAPRSWPRSDAACRLPPLMFAELGKPPAYLLSDTAIPPSPGSPTSAVHRWVSLDSAQNYRKNPHPRFGPEAIEYRFNQQGYRCAEFDQRSDEDITLAC